MNNDETQNSAAKRQAAPTMPQQGIQLSPQLQRQISVLNARISIFNFANVDVFKEIDNTFKTMATTILALQKENAELKAKSAEAPKTP